MTASRCPWRPDQSGMPNVVPPPETITVAEPERAAYDLLIATPERGPGAALLVKAGDPIPASMASRLRRRADGQPEAPPETGKRRR